MSSGEGQGHSSKKVRTFLFPQYKSLIGNNFGFIEDRAVKFAQSTGVSTMTNRIAWPSSLSWDQKYTIRLEGNLAFIAFVHVIMNMMWLNSNLMAFYTEAYCDFNGALTK